LRFADAASLSSFSKPSPIEHHAQPQPKLNSFSTINVGHKSTSSKLFSNFLTNQLQQNYNLV
jgi:hypothetical protein